jgi:hypothetical protein
MRALTRSVAATLLAATGSLPLAACGKAGEANAVDSSSPAAAPADAAASTHVPDACTVIPKSELERRVGRALRDGEPGDAPAGFSKCDFETPTGAATTRTFDNPPLPEAADFSSIAVTTHPTSAETFTQSRRATGGEQLPGIGDDAYFEGLASIHVRVGKRGLGIRVYVGQPGTEAGRQALRTVMLSLARAGAAKL